jgi:predicted phage baseplate assembly protein
MSNGPGSPCPCAQSQDPQVVSNPPDLRQIAYRVDDFTGFRRAMLRPLPGEQAIGAWQPARGDLGLQVLEWWAYLADVLTFYNERIANESYLRTAQRQSSIANLVALLGYQPAPGVAATGRVAAMRSAARPGEPLVIPAGMRLSSVATPGVPSQTFEVEAAASFTGVSSVPVTLPPDTWLPVNADATPHSVLLAGRLSGVKAGDQLVLAEKGFAGGDHNWSLVTVGMLTPTADAQTGVVNTLVTFSGGEWGPTATPPHPPDATIRAPAFRLDNEHTIVTSRSRIPTRAPATPPPATGARAVSLTSAAIAGLPGFHWIPGMTEPAEPANDGPPRQATDYRLMRPSAVTALWSQTADQAVEPPAGKTPLTVHLSAAVRAISPGDMILFDCGAGSPSALAVVAGVSEQFRAVPYPGSITPKPSDIAVAHTVLALTLAASDSEVLQDITAPATVAVRYALKDVGTIIGIPAAALASLPASATVPASFMPPSQAVTAFLQDATGTGVLVTVSGAGPSQVTLTGAGTPPSAITSPLAVPLELLLDVVPVSRGATVSGEVIGSGNAALLSQSFTLAKSPLTYLASGAGSASTLKVYVDEVEWPEVPSFYGQAPDARVLVVSRSPDQTVTTVTFGDGVNGARLTSGTGNVVAAYRYGSGAASPPAGRLTTISQPQPNLASIQNPVAVSGGADPQAPEDVRADAPASTFTFGRAISATDFKVVASQAPGVARAAAYWTFDETAQRTLVTVYVGDDQAAAAAASAAFAGSEDPNRPVAVLAATPISLQLSCTLVAAADQQVPAVVSAATAALCDPAGGLFSPARMGIGQRLYRSAVDAALMVPGVVAVHDVAVRGFPGPAGPPSLRVPRFLELDEVADPGEGSFFDLPPGSVSITGVSAGG